jgi:hypothetical protein
VTSWEVYGRRNGIYAGFSLFFLDFLWLIISSQFLHSHLSHPLLVVWLPWLRQHIIISLVSKLGGGSSLTPHFAGWTEEIKLTSLLFTCEEPSLVEPERLSHYHHKGWRSSNAFGSHSADARFESPRGHWLSWTKLYVVFLSPSRIFPGYNCVKPQRLCSQSFPIYNSSVILQFNTAVILISARVVK